MGRRTGLLGLLVAISKDAERARKRAEAQYARDLKAWERYQHDLKRAEQAESRALARADAAERKAEAKAQREQDREDARLRAEYAKEAYESRCEARRIAREEIEDALLN